MKFEEILPALREGKSVKRSGWKSSSLDPSTNWSLCHPDVLADDWEIVEDRPLPCPFCGAEFVMPYIKNPNDMIAPHIRQMSCQRCGAKGPESFNLKPHDALYAWNKAKR